MSISRSATTESEPAPPPAGPPDHTPSWGANPSEQATVLLRLATVLFLGLAGLSLTTVGPALILALGLSWVWSWVLAIFAALLVMLHLGRGWPRALTSGAHGLLVGLGATILVRPWLLPTAGPIWVALVVVVLLSGALSHWSPRQRWGAIPAALLAGGLVVVDHLAYPGLYPSLHLGLSFLGAAAATLAVARLLPRRVPPLLVLPLQLGGALLLILALVSPALATAGRRQLATTEGLAKNLLLLTWALVDFDGDGSSAVLGGGDCDDLDAGRGPTVDDRPGDGVDQDCSGFDRPRPPLPAPGPTKVSPRVVVLVTADGLRADVVGAYGFRRQPTTPNLDRFAAGARRFARVYAAAPETRLSFQTALGGYYPFVPGDAPPALGVLLRQDHRNGYAVFPAGAALEGLVGQLGLSPVQVEQERREPASSPRTIDAAIELLPRLSEEGGLLWVHNWDPHYPYLPVAGIDFGDSDFERYLAEVARWDEALGRLLTAAAGPEVAIIVAADHGEAFGEHGSTYHRTSLFDEQLRVPLLIRAPETVPGVTDETVGLIDLYATILSLLAVPPLADTPSRSLLPACRGEELPRRAYRATTLSLEGTFGPAAQQAGLIWGPYKYIRNLGWNVDDVYDLARDPAELAPGAGISPALERQLRAMF